MKKIAFAFILLGLLHSCKSKPQPTEKQHGHEHNSQEAHSHEHEAPKGERPSATQILDELDSNSDGKLSKSEAQGPLADDFTQIDTDNDGFLTVVELKNAPKPQRREENNTTEIKDRKIYTQESIKVVDVQKGHFISEHFLEEIKQEMVNLNGVETLCYIIKSNSQASEHQMGPWCPRHIDEGIEKAGIWFKDGNVYDVSGHFIANLDEFYQDNKWKLYREDGSIKVTDTEEGCLAAAKPNVEEAYQNYCVECLPDYFKHQVTTYTIPVTPTFLKSSQSFGRGGIGLAFNGVKFDPPAPTHAILAAHTIAPLDDHGGHVNPHGGYHYHAVTGSTKEIKQNDTHSPMIGYAIDGFGIFSLLDKNGNKPKDLDECGGHIDETRGYHYHAGAPGDNQIIKCLHGAPGLISLKE